MEFRILGPLEVLERNRPLELGGAKQRALLAVLLLNANRVVSTDLLVDALWDEEPPETAQKALQVYVSQLRKALGSARIVTRVPGYLIRVDADELDLERFQRLVEQGGAEALGEALSLWRGPPLADFAYERFAQTEITRLEELRLAALEGRVEADLALGGHSQLVGELESLVAEHPLRERLRGQLILALYRAGRQAEALEVYQAGRRLLSGELGLEPGEALKRLQKAVLAHDPVLDLPMTAPVARMEASFPAARSPSPAPPPIAREVRKTVTVLFVGMTGLPARGERLDPESLRRVISRAFAEVGSSLQRHGGTVETLMGDGVTAVFGIPIVHEDDALRAVRAAAEMCERLAALEDDLKSQLAARLELRIGVSTGAVVAGGPRAGAHLYAAGEPFSLATRLGRSAEPGEILVDKATHQLVRDAALAELVDGAFRLVELVPDVPRQVSRFESPMVGRDRERRRLHDAFEQAVADASCQLFTILGMAGVGKSRLLREFLGDVAGRAQVARGRCLPYGEGITYWPVIEAVKEAAGLDDAEPPEESARRLLALLEGGEEAEAVAQRVAETIGLAEALGGAEESFWAVRMFFEALARHRPLVLVFDDIHWGEATFLDLVEHLADWTRDAPIVLVCLARSELLEVRPDWGGGKLNSTSILLEPLSEEECAQLVQNLAGTDFDQRAGRRIVEAAEGNPLFVEEMLALFFEDGRTDEELEVPPTIQGLLAARLDRLGDGERAAIEAASIEGKVFNEGSVTGLLPKALRSSIHEHLMALVRKELIRPERPVFSGERAFRFRHLLIRDAAYQSVPKEARAAMHESHARWLERKIGARAVGYEEILGYHLEQAFRYRAELGPIGDADRALARRAAERLGAAGQRAFARGDGPASINLISRAVSLLPADDPSRVELVPTMRVFQGMRGDLGWAHAALSEAIAAGDPRLEAHATVQRAFLRLYIDAAVTADELVTSAGQAIRTFEELGDELGLARAWRLLAEARYLARRAGESTDAFLRALEHVRRAGNLQEEHEILWWLSIALFHGPTPEAEGTDLAERLLEDRTRDPIREGVLTGLVAVLVAMAGKLSEARELVKRVRTILDEPQARFTVPIFSTFAGNVELLAGDTAASERVLRWGYEVCEEMGERSNFSSIAAMLAQAVYAQGRYEDAEQLTRVSEEASRANDVHANIIWRATQAKLLARRGQLQAAETLAREAVAFAEESDFLNAHADALVDLAEVLQIACRPRESAHAVEQAVRLYEQKGNAVSAARARSVLEAYA